MVAAQQQYDLSGKIVFLKKKSNMLYTKDTIPKGIFFTSLRLDKSILDCAGIISS